MLASWLPAVDYGILLQPYVYVVSGGWGFSPAEASLCERLLLSVSVEIPFSNWTRFVPKVSQTASQSASERQTPYSVSQAARRQPVSHLAS